MFWVTILYGFGYVFYATAGISLDPKKKFYNKLLTPNTYFVHLIINIGISAIGYYRCKKIDPREAWIFAPLIFLAILPLINSIVRAFTNRNIFIMTRWDKKPIGYKWYIDIPASLILVITPLVTCGFLMNKFRFGTFFI